MLHRKAGTRELVEVHGTIEHSSCLSCGGAYPLDEVRARLARLADLACRACDCGEPLKPDVVLFGEFLPEGALERAYELAAGRRRAAVRRLLARGPSDRPAAAATRANGGAVALVTQGPTPWDARAAVKLDGDVVDELEALVAAL